MNWAVTLAFAAFAAALWRSRSQTALFGLASLWIAALAPSAMIAAALLGAASEQRFGDLRIDLRSATINAASLEAKPLSFGGDPIGDDVVSAGLPPAMMQIAGAGAVSIAPPSSDLTKAPAVIAQGAETPEIIGSIPLLAGDEICLERCETGGAWLKLSDDLDRLIDPQGGTPPKLIRRVVARVSSLPLVGRLPFDGIEGMADWGPALRIYPLRDFACADMRALTELDTARRPCLSAGSPARSFLYRKGGVSARGGAELTAVILDPAVRVRRLKPDGGVPEQWRMASQPHSIDWAASKDGSRHATVSIWAARFSNPDQRVDDWAAPASQLVKQATYDLAYNEDGVVVGFHQDLTALPRSQLTLDPNSHRSGWKSQSFRLGGAGTINSGDQALALLPLTSLGARLQQVVDGKVTIGKDPTYAAEGVAKGSARLGDEARFIGPETESGAAPVTVGIWIDRLDAPLWMLLLAPCWAVMVILTCGPGLLQDRPRWAIFGTLQLLLALRWLVAVEGGFLDADLPWRAMLANATVAYLAAPLTFLLLGPAALRHDRAVLALALFFVGAVIMVRLRLEEFDAFTGVMVFGTLLLAAVTLARPTLATGFEALRSKRPVLTLRPLLVPRPVVATGALVATMAACAGLYVGTGVGVAPLLVLATTAAMLIVAIWFSQAQAGRITFSNLMAPGVALFVIVLLLRGGFLAIGAKERQVVSLSILYVPLLIGAVACLLVESRRRLATEQPGAWWPPVALAGLGFAVYFATSGLVNDIGFAIFWLPAIVWALALSAVPGPGGWSRYAARIALALPGLLVLGVLVWFALAAPLWSAGTSADQIERADTPAKAEALLESLSERDRNTLRLDILGDPEGVARIGTRDAESLKNWSIALSSYTSKWDGRGFLVPSKIDLLRVVHMSDNVSAVHLMSPFGRSGAAMMLVVLALAAAGFRATSPSTCEAPHNEGGELRRTIAELSLWTLFSTAAYMILANLLLTIFTGKNVYFLAAHSNSDLVEGAMLLLIAFLAADRSTPAPEGAKP